MILNKHKTAIILLLCISSLLANNTIAQQNAQELRKDSSENLPHSTYATDLSSVRNILQDAVKSNRLKGISLMLAYDDKVIFKEAYGNMTTDQHVRIASSSKPLAATAIMILVDEGKLSLKDPLSRFLPEFKGTKVENATLLQLLSHTAGIKGSYPGGRPRSGTLADFSRLVAERGNLETPGNFSYSGVSIDIACRMAEAAAGKPFEEHIKTRLWVPLGMNNTSFVLAAETNTVSQSELRSGRGRYVSCGGGMESTLDDMTAFYQMLQHGGRHHGQMILSKTAVEEMFKKHATNPRKASSPYTTGEYGLALYRDRVAANGTALTVSHGGALGTMPWADLDRNLVGVLFTQERLNRVLPVAYEAQEEVRKLIPRTRYVEEKKRSVITHERSTQSTSGRADEYNHGGPGASYDPENTFKRISGGDDSISIEQFKDFFLLELPNSRFKDHPKMVSRIFYRLDENRDGYLTMDEYRKIRTLKSRRM